MRVMVSSRNLKASPEHQNLLLQQSHLGCCSFLDNPTSNCLKINHRPMRIIPTRPLPTNNLTWPSLSIVTCQTAHRPPGAHQFKPYVPTTTPTQVSNKDRSEDSLHIRNATHNTAMSMPLKTTTMTTVMMGAEKLVQFAKG